MPRRERRRYLALKVQSEQSLDAKAVMDAVYASVHRLFGEYGASQANLKLIDCNPQNAHLVVRCSHKVVEQVRAAIASTVEIDGKAAAIHVLGVSGTLRALSKKV